MATFLNSMNCLFLVCLMGKSGDRDHQDICTSAATCLTTPLRTTERKVHHKHHRPLGGDHYYPLAAVSQKLSSSQPLTSLEPLWVSVWHPHR